MPISGYFDTIFASSGTITTVPDAVQGDGSVSYAQGYGVDYTLPNTNPSYRYMEQGKFNQLFYDVTSAIQTLQQGSPPAFITSTMNGGTPYTYPAGATVSYSGVNYTSLVGSNTDTPPSSKWAKAYGAHTGSFTVGHLATFSDTYGTIQDGGAVPSGYTLPAATTSTLGGVIPDGTVITVSGGGNITVPNATSGAFGVVKPDGTIITVSAGVITVPTATSSVLGVVKPDGTIITNTAGAITVAKGSSSLFGVVKVDNTTITASAGVISIGASNATNTTVASPSAITSTTSKMLGLAGTITPASSGNVLVTICGNIINSAATSTRAQISYGTGGAPSNGGSVTGTQVGSNLNINNMPGGGSTASFSTTVLLTGLTAGTAYWLDLAVSAASGSMTFTSVNVAAAEIK